MTTNTTKTGGEVDTRTAEAAPCACGCGARDAAEADGAEGGRKAVGVDPAIKEASLLRLRRIEGQVRGLQRMVQEERYCADILTQISSVHEALRGVGRELMRNHLAYCATHAIQAGGEEAQAMYDELVDLMYRYAR